MIVIFAGCVIMAFSNNVKDKTWREKLSFLKKGLPGIMIAAVGTTLYTIVDSYGVRGIMEFAPDQNKLLLAGTYSCIRESSVVVLMWGCVGLCSLRKKEPGALSSLLRSYHSYLAGAMAALAYVLILLAMNYVTNVSFVQAFRQLSLPIGMLMGYFLLKEKVTLNRWIALILIMTGLILCIL
jgi:drug/metabolite transporter (DMT)-like permease